MRTSDIDTNTINDFIRTKGMHQENEIEKLSLSISTIELSDQNTILTLLNTGEKEIDLSGWYIANTENWMMDIAKETTIIGNIRSTSFRG